LEITLCRTLNASLFVIAVLTMMGWMAALVSALEQNTSLLHLYLRDSHGASERSFLALAESLPEIKLYGLASAMPSLLVGLRKNTSLFT
jgi:hypothetical protein